MGGLKRAMPITAGTFIIGWLAIAGVPPFAGFWSKDEILAKAWFSDVAGGKALWAIGLVAALLTAFYMSRQVWLVFFGNARYDSEGDHAVNPHESPMTMVLPLVVLSGLSIVGGFLSLPFTSPNLEFLVRWLEPSLEGASHIEASSFGLGFALSVGAIVIGITGIAIGRRVYSGGLAEDGTDPVETRLAGFGKVLENAYYIDAGIAKAVSGPLTGAANFLTDTVDRRLIDGAVNGTGRAFKELGGGLRRVQTGRVRSYALGIMLGAVALLGWFATRVDF